MILRHAWNSRTCAAEWDRFSPETVLNAKSVIRRLEPLMDRELDTITKADIAGIADALSPGAKHAFLNGASAFFNWCVERDLMKANPCRGLKRPKLNGWRAWRPTEWIRWTANNHQPSVWRATWLARYTGQRRSDIVRMCYEDIRLDGDDLILHVRQQKTGIELDIPLPHATNWLRRELELGMSGPIAVNRYGEPFDPKSLSKAFAAERDRLGLPKDLKLHGLRRGLAERAAEAGATTKEVMALGGWKSMKTVEGYMKDADQLTLARNAREKMDG